MIIQRGLARATEMWHNIKMKRKIDGTTYGHPCPSCGKMVDYRSKLCWDCTWSCRAKKSCIDCGMVIRPSQQRCWKCHVAHVAADKRHCLDCGAEIRACDGGLRCMSCHRKAHLPKQWTCIECDVPVGRRVKRCTPCGLGARKMKSSFPRTAVTRRKMSRAQRGKPKPGLRGKRRSPSTRQAMAASWTEERREAASQRWAGEANPGYVHGARSRAWPRQFGAKLRAMIRKRDVDTCQACGTTFPHRSRHLAVHHVDYDKANNEPMNLITVCLSCHAKTNFNRDAWRTRLQKLQVRRARQDFRPE